MKDSVISQGCLEQGTWGLCVPQASIALYRIYCVDGASVELHRELGLLWIESYSKGHTLVPGSPCGWKLHPFTS